MLMSFMIQILTICPTDTISLTESLGVRHSLTTGSSSVIYVFSGPCPQLDVFHYVKLIIIIKGGRNFFSYPLKKNLKSVVNFKWIKNFGYGCGGRSYGTSK